MRIAYAGVPGTAHAAAYVAYLAELGEASGLDVDALASADLTGVDLLVVDAPWTHPVPDGLTREQLSVPTVLVGNFGVKVGEALHLKLGTNLGCMCLDEDAVVWDPTHPVFAGLAEYVVETPSPAHLLSDASRAVFDVRESLPLLRVIREPIGVAGQVTSGLGFLDSPDCEVIAGGINEKTQDHFAIGRQARFLQWGFAGAPSDWTDQGRALFAACARYLLQFKDEPVRALRATLPRRALEFYLALEGWRGVGLPGEMRGLMEEQFLSGTFRDAAPAAARGERDERLAWFREHRDHLRNDGDGWYVDSDAAALGQATDDLAFLDACLKAGDEVLWQRYTGRTLDNGATWLETNRDHLFFTDWGGYRWVSAAEAPVLVDPPATTISTQPAAQVGAARYGDEVRCFVTIDVPAGGHAYAPGSEEGVPLEVKPGEGFELVEPLTLHGVDGHPRGQVQGSFTLRGSGSALDAALRVQLCDELTCQAPSLLPLTTTIREASS